MEQINKAIAAAVAAKLKDTCVVKTGTIVKNNGVVYHNIEIREEKENNIVPCFRTNEYIAAIQRGRVDIEEVAQDIVDAYENLDERHDLECMLSIDRELILRSVTYQVVNIELNKERLDDIPWRQFLDLAVTYRLNIAAGASTVVTKTLLQCYGVSIEELERAALKNTEQQGFRVEEMTSMLRKQLKESCPWMGSEQLETYIPQSSIPIYVFTNKTGHNGAAVLLYKKYFGELAHELDADLYLMPSSIHEVLVIPSYMGEAVELHRLVSDINTEHVAKDEILGTTVYKYSRALDAVVVELQE